MSDGIWTRLAKAMLTEGAVRMKKRGDASDMARRARVGQYPLSPEYMAELNQAEAEALTESLGNTVGAIKPGVPYTKLRKQLLGADITEMSPVQYGKHLAHIRPRTNETAVKWDTQLLGAHAEDIYQTQNPWEVVDRHLLANRMDPRKVGRGTLLPNDDSVGLYMGNRPDVSWGNLQRTSPEKGTILLLRDPEKAGYSGTGVAAHEAQHAVEIANFPDYKRLYVSLTGDARPPNRIAIAQQNRLLGGFQPKGVPIDLTNTRYLDVLANRSRIADAMLHERLNNSGHHAAFDYMEHEAPYWTTLRQQIEHGGSVHPDAYAISPTLQRATQAYKSPIRPIRAPAPPAPKPPAIDPNLWKILAAGLAGGGAMYGVEQLQSRRPELWEALIPVPVGEPDAR